MKILKDESLAKYTTIRMGGLAKNFFSPENEEELKNLVTSLDDIRFIAAGSNLLINEKACFENVVSLMDVCKDIEVEPATYEGSEGYLVYAGASLRIQKLINELAEKNIGGLEFLYPIPASVGGMIYMNAGRGKIHKSIGDYVVEVKAMDYKGNIHFISAKDCSFSWRHSLFQKDEYIILGAKLFLPFKAKEDCLKERDEWIEHCKNSQDSRYPTFGSVFIGSNSKVMGFVRKVYGDSRKYGEASLCFSKITKNWMINRGDATFEQAIKWISLVKFLHKLIGKKCETEVRIWE